MKTGNQYVDKYICFAEERLTDRKKEEPRHRSTPMRFYKRILTSFPEAPFFFHFPFPLFFTHPIALSMKRSYTFFTSAIFCKTVFFILLNVCWNSFFNVFILVHFFIRKYIIRIRNFIIRESVTSLSNYKYL